MYSPVKSYNNHAQHAIAFGNGWTAKSCAFLSVGVRQGREMNSPFFIPFVFASIIVVCCWVIYAEKDRNRRGIKLTPHETRQGVFRLVAIVFFAFGAIEVGSVEPPSNTGRLHWLFEAIYSLAGNLGIAACWFTFGLLLILVSNSRTKIGGA